MKRWRLEIVTWGLLYERTWWLSNGFCRWFCLECKHNKCCTCPQDVSVHIKKSYILALFNQQIKLEMLQLTAGSNERTRETVGHNHTEYEKKPSVSDSKRKIKQNLLSCILVFGSTFVQTKVYQKYITSSGSRRSSNAFPRRADCRT